MNNFATSKTRPQSAIRTGRYKLLQFAEDGRVELYDLVADIAEQHDLSKNQPQVAAKLLAQLRQQLDSMGARRAVRRKTVPEKVCNEFNESRAEN